MANNLASLISTRRDSEADLQHAYRIARRLKGTEIPAFQDTYGWISFRMGREAEALEYLEKAAAGLPNDPLVQEHYGLALAAAGDFEDASSVFQNALALLAEEPSETRTRLEAKLAEIDAAASAQ